jgi:hypothetical protein
VVLGGRNGVEQGGRGREGTLGKECYIEGNGGEGGGFALLSLSLIYMQY